MGLDATKPLDAPPMRYKRIHVPGSDEVDPTVELGTVARSWRPAMGLNDRSALG